MAELEKYILENYLERIVNIDEEGNKYIESEDFDDLLLNNDEKKFFLSIMKNNNIKIKKDKELIDDIEDLEAEEKDFLENFVLPSSLTKEENLELLKKYRDTKDATLKEKLVLGNLGLVDKVAKQYIKSDEDSIDELRSYGYEGLMQSIDRFDYTKGHAFSDYVIPYIRGYILNRRGEIDGIKSGVWATLFYKCKSIVEKENFQTLSENPDLAVEINELMFTEFEERLAKGQEIPFKPSKNNLFSEWQKNTNLVKITTFFNKKIEDLYDSNEDTKIDSFIDYDNIMEVESKILNDELRETLKKVTNNLNERERKIILLRYGLIDGKERTYRALGKIFDVTPARVGDIEAKAYSKIRRAAHWKVKQFLGIKELKSFLSDETKSKFDCSRNSSSFSQQNFESQNSTSNEQQLRDMLPPKQQKEFDAFAREWEEATSKLKRHYKLRR